MRIHAHKCRITGKVFEEKDIAKYMLHLKKMRAQQKEERLHERLRQEFTSWLANERSLICNVDDIIPWFMRNQRYIMDATNAIVFTGARKKYYSGFFPDDNYTNMVLTANYKQHVSNTHHCPDNGVTNWHHVPELPTGYPGWRGYLHGSLNRNTENDSSYPYGDALNIVGIKTGTGGGGNKNWSYDVYIFLADWPGCGQQLTVDKLKGVS